MKRLRFSHKEVKWMFVAVGACSLPLWLGVARSRAGADLTALAKRTLPLSISDEALLLAVKADNLAGVQKAIAQGADINCQDRIRPVGCLGEGATTYNTPLILSAYDSFSAKMARVGKPKSFALMRFLLAHGADPNIDSSHGRTALIVVASEGNLEATRLLLDAGADPNKTELDGDSPLGEACYRRHLDVAKLLRTHGASVKDSEFLGATPLHKAVGYSDSPAIALWLLSQGADPNARNELGQTPLHWAAEYGRVETVRLLVRAGANPSLASVRDGSPLDVARRYATSIIGRRDEELNRKWSHRNAQQVQSAQQIQDELLAAMQSGK